MKDSKIMNPYTGLRPFEEDYSSFFFGRDKQIQELHQRLRFQKFVAVLGYSGSGKSSLIKCGLVPSLKRDDSRRWRMVECRPGSSPMANLSNALVSQEADLFNQGDGMDDFVHSMLQRSSKGLQEALAYSKLEEEEHILILIDQFEELFRFRKYENLHGSTAGESLRFVNLLINAIEGLDDRIHLVITMRSEFLGDCAHFQGFPDAINLGQFLIPPMNRVELKEVIIRPIEVINQQNGTKISLSRGLVETILNDLSNDQDQLPILQHTLSRTWQQWVDKGGEGLVGLSHYEGIGGMKNALNNHADYVFDSLKAEWKRSLCQRIFRAITERDADGIETRRPEKLSHLGEIVQMDERSILDVINAFQVDGSFIQTYEHQEEEGETDLIIDISHESLMRKWDLLSKWVLEEAEAAAFYFKLASNAQEQQNERGDLLAKNSLLQATNWWKTLKPNMHWAKRYDDLRPGFIRFPGVASYLSMSQKSEKRKMEHELRNKKRMQKVRQVVFISVTIAALFFSGLSALAWYQNRALEKKEKDLQEKNSALISEKAKVVERTEELEITVIKLNETKDSLQIEKTNLLLREEQLEKANDSLSNTTDLLQKRELQLVDTISELHSKRQALADTISELVRTDSILDEKIVDLRLAHSLEVSRNRSLQTINLLELGKAEEALEMVVGIKPDSISKQFSNENFNAFNAVWNQETDEGKTYYDIASVLNLDIRSSQVVYVNNFGTVVFGKLLELDTSAQIEVKQKLKPLRGKEDQVEELKISQDGRSVYLMTMKGSIQKSKKEADGFGSFRELTATGASWVKLDLDREVYYFLEDNHLVRGKLNDPTVRESLYSLDHGRFNFLTIEGQHLFAATERGELLLYDFSTGSKQLLKIASSSALTAVKLIDKNLLVFGNESGQIRMQGLVVEEENIGGVAGGASTIDTHASSISAIASKVLLDSKIQVAVSGYDGKASLFNINLETQEIINKLDLEGHKQWIYGIDYFDLSKYAVTHSEDKTIRFWPISARQAREALKKIRNDKNWNYE